MRFWGCVVPKVMVVMRENIGWMNMEKKLKEKTGNGNRDGDKNGSEDEDETLDALDNAKRISLQGMTLRFKVLRCTPRILLFRRHRVSRSNLGTLVLTSCNICGERLDARCTTDKASTIYGKIVDHLRISKGKLATSQAANSLECTACLFIE